MSDAVLLRLVRHGEVAEPYRGRFYGSYDVPLSAAGLEASHRLAERLATEGVDAVHTSPLSRARVLADRVAELSGAPLTVHTELTELDRGAWTLRDRREVETGSPGAIERYLADPEHGNGPGGEPESVFCARVWDVIDRIVRSTTGERLVVVSHGHVMRAVMRRLLGWDATTSLRRFVPYHGVVDVRVAPDGTSEVLAMPELAPPAALAAPGERANG